MKRKFALFFSLLLLIIGSSATAQKKAEDVCPPASLALYSKVMNTDFSREFSQCPVIIECEFFKVGFPKNLTKPPKLKKMMFFQCLETGSDPAALPLSGEISGDYFVIDKTRENEIFALKKGDKFRITGKTFTATYLGMTDLAAYFVVETIEKISENED